MDTSEQYIEMCAKAEKIQEGKPQDVGGVCLENSIIVSTTSEFGLGDYYHVVDEEGVRCCKECGHEEPYIISSKVTWLPHQDELQAMVFAGPFGRDIVGNLNEFNRWAKLHSIWGDSSKEEEFQSLEQLWLAFVMQEKYGKVWKGEEWEVSNAECGNRTAEKI